MEQAARAVGDMHRRGLFSRLGLLGRCGSSAPFYQRLKDRALSDLVKACFDRHHPVVDSFNLPDSHLDRNLVDTLMLVLPPGQEVEQIRFMVQKQKVHTSVILPFTTTSFEIDFDLTQLNLNNKHPILFVYYPCAGTNRMSPSVAKILEHYRWKFQHCHSLIFNSRFLDGIEWESASVLDAMQNALDRQIGARIRELDYGEVLQTHDPVSISRLADIRDLRTVYLIRDPRDIVISMYFRLYGTKENVGCGTYIGELNEELKEARLLAMFEGGEFQRSGCYVNHFPDLKWIASNFAAGISQANIKLIKFEDLHRSPSDVYRGLISWLGFDKEPFIPPLSDKELEEIIHLGSFELQTKGLRQRGEESSAVVMQNGVQTSCRKGVPGDWRQHFSARVKARCKELIGNELIYLGYEKDYGW